MVGASTTYRSGAAAAELAAVLAEGGFSFEEPQTVRVVVLDTFDGRLASRGWRLTAEVELTADDDEQDGGAVTVTLAGESGAPAEVSLPDLPRTADDVPAGPLRARLADALDVRVLLPLLTLTTNRTPGHRRNADDKIVASAVLHEEVVAGEGSDRIDGTFVEIDQLAGYAKPAAAANRLLAGRRLEPLPHGLCDLAAQAIDADLAGTVVEPGVALDPDQPAIDGFRAVLANLRDAIVANYDGTIEHLDPEFLHDLRVAVRRTRGVLSNAKRIIPPAVLGPFRDDFRWFGQITGPSRDLDVDQIEWPSYVAGLAPDVVVDLEPIREHLAVERTAAHATLSAELRSERARAALAAWDRWLDEPLDGPLDGPVDDRSDDAAAGELPSAAMKPLGPFVAKRIRRAHDALIAGGRAITADSPPEDLHELRKDAKRLRYLFECFAGLYRPARRKQLKAFVTRLKALQENLGEHQDTEVHATQLRGVSATLAELGMPVPLATTLATGRAIERMDQRHRASRREFAGRFADFDSATTRDALDALLADDARSDRAKGRKDRAR